MDDDRKEIEAYINALCTQKDYDLTAEFSKIWEREMSNVVKGLKSRKSFEDYILPVIQKMIASWDCVSTETCMAIGAQLNKEDSEVFESFVFKSVTQMNPGLYLRGLVITKNNLAEIVDKEMVQRFTNLVEGQHQLWKHKLRRQLYKAFQLAFNKAIANKEVPEKISISASTSEELEAIGRKLGKYFTEHLSNKGWSPAFLDNYYKIENVGELIMQVGRDLGVFCEYGGAPDTLK